MTIEFIDNTNKFFDDVKALGRKNSSTLGFMPEGGFEDHARNKCIIIARQKNKLVGYLMYRVVSRYSRISIVHLCVVDAFRGKGVSTSLLNALKGKYEKLFRGISLSCRKDFTHATAMWEKYGFTPIKEVRSRSFDENYLNTWWYDFHQPDLFSHASYETSKVKALLDTNIIVKLRDAKDNAPQNPTEDPRGLLADWLVDEAELCYSSEVYNEVNRDNDSQRAKHTREFLPNFIQVQFDSGEQNRIASELKTIIHGNSANDISDRKQLASCIASHTPYFITYDEGILNKKDDIESSYSIQIFNPQEFIIQIDQLLHADEYLPNQIKGVVFHSVSKLNPKDMQFCIDKFWKQHDGEAKNSFSNLVSQIINSANGRLFTVRKQEEIIAFYGISKEQNQEIVEFIRVIDNSSCNSLFCQIVFDVLSNSLKDDKEKVLIRESYLKTEWKNTLVKFGFIPSQDGYTKFALNRQINKQDLKLIIQESNIPLEVDDSDETGLIKVEKLLFPLKISGLTIPTYIIPIKSYWAGQLFDYGIAGEDMFGADPNKLWSFENVYYRHVNPLHENAPARILWYVSGGDKGFSRSKTIVASSYLTEVQTGKPKELFRLYKHFGIYEWNHIYELCNKDITKDIKVLKFSHTEVFDNPVSYEKVMEVFKNNGRPTNTFVSPVIVSESIYFEIYNLGKRRKSE